MKRYYQKPELSVVMLQHQTQMLSSSPGYEVIGTDKPNQPPAVRGRERGDYMDWDDEW